MSGGVTQTAHATDEPSTAGALPAAVFVCPETLTQRSDFLRAAQARRQGTTGFHLQARDRGADDPAPGLVRVGYTCSKKVGNAVARNRAKRRLREIARLVLPQHGKPGWDYVLVGRPQVTDTHDFAQMQADLVTALDKVHR